MSRASLAFKLPVALLLLAPVGLAGCASTDRIKTSSIPMEDYRIRHPIVLTEGRTSIDVFPSMGQAGLDRHTAKQVYALAAQYRETGRGPILILLPRDRDHHNVVGEIRQALATGGARTRIDVSTYPVGDPNLASPIRVSFSGMRAQVADQCGQWPNDLGSGSSIEGWENKPYWNFGCSTQSMMAAQVSDPRDLVTPRGEEPADTQIRARAIDAIRKGTDPNTAWSVKNSNIGGVGAN